MHASIATASDVSQPSDSRGPTSSPFEGTAACPDRPSFLITVDTEGDNAWLPQRVATTRNSKFLGRFQTVCESYGLKPTYLTNFEMAQCPDFQELGRDVLRRRTGEIGMHLHAWNSPPLAPLTADDSKFCPYLIEYPKQIMREKIGFMTALLEETFGVKMVSHRAGRWSFNTTYARLLVEMGYRVDCSVTPHVSWRKRIGDPNQFGGSDYRQFPELPYFMDLDNIAKSGTSPLLEIPVTIMNFRTGLTKKIDGCLDSGSWPRRLLARLSRPIVWLRPNGRNLSDMLRILHKTKEERRPCVELMLHSSELMPGGSPFFPRDEDIESLYGALEQLFDEVARFLKGETLTQFWLAHARQNARSEVLKVPAR